MHEVIYFHVEILVKHKSSSLGVRSSLKKFCLLSSYLSKKVGFLVASFRILDRFFQSFFTWVVGGRVRQWRTLGNFQCRGVLLFWIIVGGTVLAVGAGEGCFDHHLPLFLSFHID